MNRIEFISKSGPQYHYYIFIYLLERIVLYAIDAVWLNIMLLKDFWKDDIKIL